MLPFMCQLIIPLFAKNNLINPPKNAPQPAARGTWQLPNTNEEEMIMSLHSSEQRCIVAL